MTKLRSSPATGDSVSGVTQHVKGYSNKLYLLLLGIISFTSLSFYLISSNAHSNNNSSHERAEKSLLQVFVGKGDNDNDNANLTNNSTIKVTNLSNHRYHIVCSTSCDDQQHWESYVFFYHALKVDQPGSVTRIASGCSKERGVALQDFHNAHIRDRLSNDFHLHLTPDFSKVPAKGPDGIKIGGNKMTRYKYMNKPFGLLHWMENVLRKNETAAYDDDIVILMDPDMVLLRLIVHDYTNENVIFVEDNPKSMIVSHGHPIAQQDGYLNNEWMGLNVSYVTGEELPPSVNPRAGPKHYNTGPPYLATESCTG